MNKPKLIKDLSPKEITYLKASSNYTFIHTQKGKKLVSGYSLNKFEELFSNYKFIRIDRSHLVHRSHIKSVDFINQNTIIRLADKQEFTIPRRRRKKFWSKLGVNT